MRFAPNLMTLSWSYFTRFLSSAPGNLLSVISIYTYIMNTQIPANFTAKIAVLLIIEYIAYSDKFGCFWKVSERFNASIVESQQFEVCELLQECFVVVGKLSDLQLVKNQVAELYTNKYYTLAI